MYVYLKSLTSHLFTKAIKYVYIKDIHALSKYKRNNKNKYA